MAVSFYISQHAALRYCERVEPGATVAQARAAIRSHAHAIEAAIKVGCCSIRLGCGARIILKGCEIVTVLPAQPKRNGHKWGRKPDFRATRGFTLKGASDD